MVHSRTLHIGFVPCALPAGMLMNLLARISHACKSVNVHPQREIDVVPHCVCVSLRHTRPNRRQRARSRKHKRSATDPYLSPLPNARRHTPRTTQKCPSVSGAAAAAGLWAWPLRVPTNRIPFSMTCKINGLRQEGRHSRIQLPGIRNIHVVYIFQR